MHQILGSRRRGCWFVIPTMSGSTGEQGECARGGKRGDPGPEGRLVPGRAESDPGAEGAGRRGRPRAGARRVPGERGRGATAAPREAGPRAGQAGRPPARACAVRTSLGPDLAPGGAAATPSSASVPPRVGPGMTSPPPAAAALRRPEEPGGCCGLRPAGQQPGVGGRRRGYADAHMKRVGFYDGFHLRLGPRWSLGSACPERYCPTLLPPRRLRSSSGSARPGH